MLPKYVLKVTEWPTRIFQDSKEEPLVSWHVCQDEEEVDKLIESYGRPGFGQPLARVSYEKYFMGMVLRGTVEAEPITMLEMALEFLADEPRVNVALKGQYWDPKAVYWDSRGNSFAIVKPPTDPPTNNKRAISQQGVLLLSINGHGEVRWSVDKGCATWSENNEAVEHFGLTWAD